MTIVSVCDSYVLVSFYVEVVKKLAPIKEMVGREEGTVAIIFTSYIYSS